MHTIHVNDVSPVVMSAARRADPDCWVMHNGLPRAPVDWLTLYWRARIRAVLPQFHDEESAMALSRLADALACEDVTEAVDVVLDYRESTGRPVNDGTLTRMMVGALLDWSKWTGDPRIDDARAQDWLRSLLA